MAFWLADGSVRAILDRVREQYNPHLAEARIAILFCDKRKVSGNRITLGSAKKVSPEDKVLSDFDFKIVLSSEDWTELSDTQKIALVDHELYHCDVVRVPKTETVGGRKKPIKDQYGRTIYTSEVKVDDDGKPRWKMRAHDFENFLPIAERYGIEIASVIGGFFPVENGDSAEV